MRIPVTTQEPIAVNVGQAQEDERSVAVRFDGQNYVWGVTQGVKRIKIRLIHLDILTGAVAGDRYPRIQINRAGMTAGHPQVLHLIGTQATPISTSGFWSWQIGGEHLARFDAAIGYVETNALPSELYMNQGDFLTVYFSNGDASDNAWFKMIYTREQ